MPKTAKKANGTTTTQRVTAEQVVQIEPPKLEIARFRVTGITPYMQNKFSQRARDEIQAQQEKGGAAKSKRKRDPKDFAKVCEEATHFAADGWVGIPAPAFREAMISACRVAGFVMTRAKLAVRVVQDGFDKDDGTPLVKIDGDPVMDIRAVRPQRNTMDLASRPRWDEWQCELNVQYDADLFTLNDVTNLLMRAGLQVGIGCGRPDSSDSCGMDYGLFKIEPLDGKGVSAIAAA